MEYKNSLSSLNIELEHPEHNYHGIYQHNSQLKQKPKKFSAIIASSKNNDNVSTCLSPSP